MHLFKNQFFSKKDCSSNHKDLANIPTYSNKYDTDPRTPYHNKHSSVLNSKASYRAALFTGLETKMF